MATMNSNEEEISKEVSRSDFPPDFVFGVATSAYQVEGASKEGNRGDSIWDVFSHIEGKIKDGSNGDIAVDQYHRYKISATVLSLGWHKVIISLNMSAELCPYPLKANERKWQQCFLMVDDVELMAKLGFGAYRFSISWSRIFPDGLGTNINVEGINYYNNVINALLEKDLYFAGQTSSKYFAIYAETCFENFGDRVKHWITINEPLQTAVNGHCIGIFAPGRSEQSETEPYLASHYQILAHAKAVSVYRNKYKAKQGGDISLVVDCEWAEPFSDKVDDKLAAARRLDFQLGWYLPLHLTYAILLYLDPLYYGDYPEVMRERLGDRLPKFSQDDKELLRNSIDFIGLNHYTSRFISHVTKNPKENDYYQVQEMQRMAEWAGGEVIGDRAASEWLYIVPWGIRKVLNYVAQRYHGIPIYITENGMDDEDDETLPLHEVLDDKMRVGYFKGYLAAVAQAIRDGVDVKGYFAWSLLDNFEWSQGYTKRFGLVFVDYKNGLVRHPKSSALWFSRFLKGTEGKNKKED
ncbi:hypothetical protein HHK36_013360 [Tetracentron sinense]|uniref:Beta-glucosidase n=1 Tax=Tetracentron sinense TaxID=13715 RepID=A0A834ZAJ7_TETSI|nr:hypothetical protein HHK36_013360 [Tetracentron sinense]